MESKSSYPTSDHQVVVKPPVSVCAFHHLVLLWVVAVMTLKKNLKKTYCSARLVLMYLFVPFVVVLCCVSLFPLTTSCLFSSSPKYQFDVLKTVHMLLCIHIKKCACRSSSSSWASKNLNTVMTNNEARGFLLCNREITTHNYWYLRAEITVVLLQCLCNLSLFKLQTREMLSYKNKISSEVFSVTGLQVFIYFDLHSNLCPKP